MATPALDRFHPAVRAWFLRRYGTPTDVQARAWTRIAKGDHVLVTAPTGSGKTLAAFLWTLDGLLGGRVEPGVTRTLYVSPLRALNNDIQRNLLAPLNELSVELSEQGIPAPPIQVVTRSGDTPTDERERMARRPPEILITTPESLSILLTSQRGRRMLAMIDTVILDEVHAVAGAKRGVHLMSAVERLAHLAGEFQRIALSATVQPPARVARWVGGWQPAGPRALQRREVHLVEGGGSKSYELEVVFPGTPANALDEQPDDTVWPAVAAALRDTVRSHRSTLVFANSRRTVEKLARIVNEDQPDDLVVAHHGSLSREIRHVVEARLKAGDVRGIIATSSLELGIDIGTLDEVVLVQTPPSIASTVQRIGRAGHAVGETSRARFLPIVPRDTLDSAVAARAVLEGYLEPIRPVRAPLDVLAQIIVSAVAAEEWQIDDLFALLTRVDSYHDLPRTQFDLVLEMLAGRYATTRVRELEPIVSVDRVRGTVSARPGAAMRVYMAGGTIPDRGYFRLRRADSLAVVGELDEEFVWERSIGDTFTLGVQSWQITDITHNDVLVVPARSGASLAPFWRAESRDRSFELSERIGLFLEDAEHNLDDPSWRASLLRAHRLDSATSELLTTWLGKQRAAMGGHLPHRHRVVLEHVSDPQGRGETSGYVLHTTWGGRVNRPLAVALQAALVAAAHGSPQVMHEDDCILLTEVRDLRVDELFDIVPPERVLDLLRSGLESTGFFGARFREAAGRALLLPRAGFNRRTPLWLSRLRAKKLLDAVARFDDFPLRLEAWRECLQDAFDTDALRALLEEIRTGDIALEQVTTSTPSPFAAAVTWRQTNQLMYEDDTPEMRAPAPLRSDLVREVAQDARMRPRIAPAYVRELEGKVQRLAPGWAPRTARELLDHLVERLLVPVREWNELLSSIGRDLGEPAAPMLHEVRDRVVAVCVPGGAWPSFVAAVELLPRVGRALGWTWDDAQWRDPADMELPCSPEARRAARHLLRGKPPGDAPLLSDLVGDWLAAYGPIAPDSVMQVFGLDGAAWESALQTLLEAGRVVTGPLTEGAQAEQVSDAQNLERLLRMQRAGARPSFEPLPLALLPCFLARHQGLEARRTGVDGLRHAMDRLIGYPALGELWETELLPARVDGYQTAWLDALLAETPLRWLGCAKETLTFLSDAERDLAGPAGKTTQDDKLVLASMFPHPSATFGAEEMRRHALGGSGKLMPLLWRLAWKGLIVNDGFAAVRRGIESRFQLDHTVDSPVGPRGSRRPRGSRWYSGFASAGSWRLLPSVSEPSDPLEQEELQRDRARMVLDRWGVVFRELLERELPALQWAQLSRTLRRMELSGEVVAGQFFLGVSGLQFASREAMKSLRSNGSGGTFWLCAQDPISPCGLGLGVGEPLPRRLRGNHLVYADNRLVVISENRAGRLDIRLAPDDPRLPACLSFLTHLLTRQVRPEKALKVERINGIAASLSPYRPALEKSFLVSRDKQALVLMRRYGVA